MKIGYIASYLLIISLLFGCFSKKPVKIAYIADITGELSELGVSGMYGAEMAVKEINNNGGINGRELKMTILDDKNNKKEILALINNLVDKDIKGIIGPMTSSMAEDIVPIINENELLMISPAASSEILSARDDYFLRVIPSNKYQGIYTSKNMSFQNVKKAAILYEYNNQYFTKVLKNEFSSHFIDNGGEIVYSDTFKTTENTNYEKLLENSYNSGAQGIFIIGPSYETANFCQILDKKDFKFKVFLPTWSMTGDLLKLGGSTVEGVNLVNFIDCCSIDEKYGQFNSKFIDNYGEKATFPAIFSYESVSVLANALSNTNMESSEMKEYIINKKTFSSPQGNISFDKYGDIKRKVYIYKIVNGEYKIIDID